MFGAEALAMTMETVIRGAYAAFNRRDVDAALALMREDVSWPKASDGGRVVGHAEIRAYWTRQWQEFDPEVEPLEIVVTREDVAEVRVRQVVKSLGGDVLADGEVRHVFTVVDGLIVRMDLGEEGVGPSAAFVRG